MPIGSVTLNPEPVVTIPGTALIQIDGKPAVWVVDPATSAVVARPVKVERYDSSSVIKFDVRRLFRHNRI